MLLHCSHVYHFKSVSFASDKKVMLLKLSILFSKLCKYVVLKQESRYDTKNSRWLTPFDRFCHWISIEQMWRIEPFGYSSIEVCYKLHPLHWEEWCGTFFLHCIGNLEIKSFSSGSGERGNANAEKSRPTPPPTLSECCSWVIWKINPSCSKRRYT